MPSATNGTRQARLEQQVSDLWTAVRQNERTLQQISGSLYGDNASHRLGLVQQMEQLQGELVKLDETMTQAEERYQREQAVKEAIERERTKWLKIIGTVLAGGQGLSILIQVLNHYLS